MSVDGRRKMKAGCLSHSMSVSTKIACGVRADGIGLDEQAWVGWEGMR